MMWIFVMLLCVLNINGFHLLSKYSIRHIKQSVKNSFVRVYSASSSQSSSNNAKNIDGLVIERLSDKVLVEYSDDNTTICQVLCSQKLPNGKSAVVGDLVKLSLPVGIDSSKVTGTVVDIKDRLNTLERPSPSSEGRHKLVMKMIASNIDQVVIVTAAKPTVPLYTIDQLIVGATLLKIPNIAICINKADIEGSDELYSQYDIYRRLQYPTFRTSTLTCIGTRELEEFMAKKTCILIGQSGVGKSSLVNALIPDGNARVGELIQKVDVGAHTTSNARLYHLPSGGKLIDSPGIREFGLWQYDSDQVKQGFMEVEEYSHNCKFSNCKHDERAAGCAVVRALKDGNLSSSRYNNFMKIAFNCKR
jgi:ribosome biogenesis GTPase / thiamine phosphate phosphatase